MAHPLCEMRGEVRGENRCAVLGEVAGLRITLAKILFLFCVSDFCSLLVHKTGSFVHNAPSGAQRRENLFASCRQQAKVFLRCVFTSRPPLLRSEKFGSLQVFTSPHLLKASAPPTYPRTRKVSPHPNPAPVRSGAKPLPTILILILSKPAPVPLSRRGLGTKIKSREDACVCDY